MSPWSSGSSSPVSGLWSAAVTGAMHGNALFSMQAWNSKPRTAASAKTRPTLRPIIIRRAVRHSTILPYSPAPMRLPYHLPVFAQSFFKKRGRRINYGVTPVRTCALDSLPDCYLTERYGRHRSRALSSPPHSATHGLPFFRAYMLSLRASRASRRTQRSTRIRYGPALTVGESYRTRASHRISRADRPSLRTILQCTCVWDPAPSLLLSSALAKGASPP